MQDLKALEGKSLAELREIAKALGIKNVMIKKRELIEKIAGTDTPEEAPAENEAGAKGEVSETAAKPAQEAAPQTAAPKAKAPRGRRPRLAKNENAAPQPEAAAEPEPEPEQLEKKSSGGLLVVVLLLVLAGGGVFAYVKFIKPKQGVKVSADPEDYDFEDEEMVNEDTEDNVND